MDSGGERYQRRGLDSLAPGGQLHTMDQDISRTFTAILLCHGLLLAKLRYQMIGSGNITSSLYSRVIFPLFSTQAARSMQLLDGRNGIYAG